MTNIASHLYTERQYQEVSLLAVWVATIAMCHSVGVVPCWFTLTRLPFDSTLALQVAAAYSQLQAAGDAGQAIAGSIQRQAALSLAHLGRAEQVGRAPAGLKGREQTCGT